MNIYTNYTLPQWQHEIEQNRFLPSGYTFIKYTKFALSLALNDLMSRIDALVTAVFKWFGVERKPKWTWWNSILQLNRATLYLGATPLTKHFRGKETRNDPQEIAKLGVGAVLSILEPFETTTPAFTWEKLKIRNLQIPSPDFGPVSIENIAKGVAFIHWNMQNDVSVYTHCKAGRGRSALVELCYLIHHQNMTAEDALKLLQKNRPQVHLGKAQWAVAKEYKQRVLAEQ